MITLVLYYFIIFLALLFLVSYVCAQKIKDTSKYLTNVPGPKPVFPFGNTLDFISGSTVILEVLTDYINKYGETVIFHDGAFSRTLVTVDYNLMEFVYNSTTEIQKADQYSYFDGWLGQGLLTSTGQLWRSHRKAITPSFHFSILREFVGVFDSVSDQLVAILKKDAGKDSVEISKIVSQYALDVICEAAMGVKVDAQHDENSSYIKSIKTMCGIIIHRSFSALNAKVYPLTHSYYKEKRALKGIHDYVDNVIAKRIEEHNNKASSNSGHQRKSHEDDVGVKRRMAFLDLLLKATINGQPLTRKELRDEVNTFMFEGHDTTSSAITFCLLMLATHPHCQKKVLKEQRRIFGEDLKDARPNYSQLNEMKYLEMVVKETLRLYPSVPFFGRKLTKDIEFEGTLYPKGLSLMLVPFVIQRNAKYFSDPEKFIPERFEDNSGKLPFIYTPFSAGPRNCIGQKFAMLEMLSTVSKVIRNFEVGPAKPQHKIQLASETILISKNGVKISLKNR